MARVASAKPDGSTLYATTPTYVFTSLMSKPQSTFRDLEPTLLGRVEELIDFVTEPPSTRPAGR